MRKTKERGITLIALVITIIILLILAGITISTLSGENGLFTRAKQARQNTIDAQAAENDMLTEYENIINSIIDGKGNDDDIVNDPITEENYGEYVDLETELIVNDNIELEDGTHPTTDWRIFHKDKNGGVYLILADYLPYSYESTVNSGLIMPEDSLYNWMSDYSRRDLITRLQNTSSWNNLIGNKYLQKGISVTGSPDVETWIASWNANGYMELFWRYVLESEIDEESDEGEGYLVGNTNPPQTHACSLTETSGYNDSLYFPHKNAMHGNHTNGYWIASLSNSYYDDVINVIYNGTLTHDTYDTSGDLSVRPMVYIPAGINFKKVDGTWKVLL